MIGSGLQTEDEYTYDLARRTRPWDEQDYIRLKLAAQALVRTHTSLDLPGKRTLAAFDGSAYWELLGALDRADVRRE
jgi:hypothetical protein